MRTVERGEVLWHWERPRVSYVFPPAALFVVGILHLISAALALAIAYRLLRTYSTTRQPLLLSVGVSFALIGFAYAFAGVSGVLAVPGAHWAKPIQAFLLLTSCILSTFGYVLLLMSYVANRLGVLAFVAHPLYWSDVVSAIALVLSSAFAPRGRFRVGYVCMGLGHLIRAVSLRLGVLDVYVVGDLLKVFGVLVILAHVMSR